MNISEKAKQLLRALAPTIGTAIGGPFGTVAGSLLSQALGTPADDTKAAESALLTANPDTLLKVKQAEQDFQIRMRELGITEDKLVYDDLANARAREVSIRDWTPRVLAYGVVAVTAIVEGYAVIHGLPKDIDQVIVGRVLGTLDAATMLVLGYYFGTTASSHRKDETLAEIARS